MSDDNNNICNAKITGTHLGYEDHGILTCTLSLDYGGSGQVFGGYSLDAPVKVKGKFSHREATQYGMAFIKGILDALCVDSWEKLEGTHIRVMQTHSKVIKIGHIVQNRWFDPEELQSSLKGKESENS